jgi:hypothetical protein
MGLFTKDIKTMDDLLLHGLQDIYYAEQQITKALPKMIDKATNRDLVDEARQRRDQLKQCRIDPIACHAFPFLVIGFPDTAGVVLVPDGNEAREDGTLRPTCDQLKHLRQSAFHPGRCPWSAG